MAQPFALAARSPRRHHPRLLVPVLAGLLLVSAAGAWVWHQGWLASWLGPGDDSAHAVVLSITSQPAGAAISIDGHDRGHTPANVGVAPGRHTVVLQAPEFIPSRREVTVGADGSSLALTLWARQPQLAHLRPTYPGASIAAAAFVRDGRLGLVIGLPAGGREAWLLDPAAGSLERIGPAGQWAALAVAPDGARVAYLAASMGALPATVATQTLPGSSPNTRLDEVWVSGAEREAAPRRVLQLPQGNERLVDLSWSPDGQQLLLVTRQTLTLGGEQTRLLWLGLDGDTVAGAEPRELVTLPGQVVPGSYTWEPGGRVVAVLVRPGTGPQTAVCLLEPATSAFRYLGDLVPDVGSSAAPTAAPVAWEASGSALYAVSAPPAASARDDTPLFGLRPMGGPRATLGLFRARSPAGTDDERLPNSDGTTGLAVRDDGMLLGLSRPRSDGPVVLRAIDRAGNQPEDLAELSVPPSPSGASLAGRWDLDHAQLVLALPSASLAAHAAADYWLVRFTAAGPAAEAAR